MKLLDIKEHKDLQPREKLNDEMIDAYANSFDSLPPVTVFQIEGKKGWHLVDGWHRVAAARRINRSEIDVIKETGTWEEAKETAFDANMRHGLALTLKERKKAAELKLMLHTERSNSWIAEECGISYHTVEKIRLELEGARNILPLSDLVDKLGRNIPRHIEQPSKDKDKETNEVEETIEEVVIEELPKVGQWELNNVSIVDAIEGLRGLPTESVDLVFADPPYNLGKDYGEGIIDKRDKYYGWCAQWFIEVARVMKHGGSFYVMHYPETCAEWKQTLDNFLDFQRWITWIYNINTTGKNNWRRSHRTILFYSKGNPKHFDGLADAVPYKNPDDKRVKQLNPIEGGTTPTDVWEYQLVKNVSEDKTSWPNQLPVELLERIIKVSSGQDDLVVDPFMGSGTTAVAASRCNRSWIGFDVSEQSKEVINARLEK